MSTKSERTLIFAVTIGSILEWYEFSLFAYIAPILSHNYFRTESAATGLLYTMAIYAGGFLTRPLGGLFFGYLGDRRGRRYALLCSLMLMTVPTFCIGLLPDNLRLGISAPAILLALRLIQGLVTGGELAGSMCYLTEGIAPKRRTFFSSWTFLGVQLGGILSLLECIFLSRSLSMQEFMQWGWRISFMIGGSIGLLGLFLRFRLKETSTFTQLEKNHEVLKQPLFRTFHCYKVHLLQGFLLPALPLATNFLLFAFGSIYFQRGLDFSFQSSLIFTVCMIALATVFLPVFGKLGTIYPRKSLLIAATLLLIMTSYPFFIAVRSQIFALALPLSILCILCLSCYFALLPITLVELFPAPIRYTSLGFSYNASATFFGGTAPVLSLYLIDLTNDPTAPCLIIIFSGILSLIALLTLKEPIHAVPTQH